jgi:hypothetical protein
MWQGARVAQHGNYARNGSNEAGWVYTGWQPGTKNGNSGLGLLESVGMEEMRRTAPMEAVGCMMVGGQEAKTEAVIKKVGVLSDSAFCGYFDCFVGRPASLAVATLRGVPRLWSNHEESSRILCPAAVYSLAARTRDVTRGWKAEGASRPFLRD